LGAESIKTLQAVLSAAILLFIFAGHYQAAKLWAIPQESPTKRIDKTFVFTQYIFSLAFREASALTGFVLSILTGDHIWSLGSSVVVVLSIIGTAPSNTKLDALMNQFS